MTATSANLLAYQPALASLCLALAIFTASPSAGAQFQVPASEASLPIPVAAVPMRIIAGKFVVDAMLDGRGPFAIAIDSGAETLIVTPHVARLCRFQLQHGTVAVTGTQSRAAMNVAQAHVGSIRIGGAIVQNPFCTVSPMPLPVDGYIGAPLLNTFVTEIDPHAKLVRLYTPQSFASVRANSATQDDNPGDSAAAQIAAAQAARALAQQTANDSAGTGVQVLQSDGTPVPPQSAPPPNAAPDAPAPAPTPSNRSTDKFGVEIPITLGFHRVPVAQGTLGSVPIRLEIDTGSAFPAELTAPFVHANNLARRFDRMGSVRLISSGVVGLANVYAFDDLTLGTVPQPPNQAAAKSGAKIEGTIPTLFLASPGVNGGPGEGPQYDGRIGAPLLAQFAVTFDYARSRVFLRPVPPTAVALPHIAQQRPPPQPF